MIERLRRDGFTLDIYSRHDGTVETGMPAYEVFLKHRDKTLSIGKGTGDTLAKAIAMAIPESGRVK